MAVRFDAATDAYTATTGIPTSNVYTVLYWLYLVTDRNTFSTHFMVQGTGGGGVLWFDTNSDGTTVQVETPAFDFGGYAVTTGTWHRVALSMNGDAANFYRGPATGALTLASGTIPDPITTPTSISIGCDAGSNFWNGRIAGFKLYDAVLTQGEIEAELLQYTPMRTANLLRWHPFVNAEAVDYSGNGNTLTAGSSATATEPGPPLPWSNTRRLQVYSPVVPATGSLAGTLPAATGSIAGTASAAGSISGSVPALAGSVSGTATATGSVTGSAPALTGSLSGTAVATGAVAGQLPLATASLTGTATASGTLQGAIPPATGSVTGTAGAAGALSASLPPLTGSVTGLISEAGTLGGTTPAATGALTGAASTGGSVTATLPAATGSFSAVVDTGGATLAAALPPPTLALVGAASAAGVLHGTAPTIQAAWTGNSGIPDQPVQAGTPVVAVGPRTLAPVVAAGLRTLTPVVAVGLRTLAPVLEPNPHSGPPTVTQQVRSGAPYLAD